MGVQAMIAFPIVTGLDQSSSRMEMQLNELIDRCAQRCISGGVYDIELPGQLSCDNKANVVMQLLVREEARGLRRASP